MRKPLIAGNWKMNGNKETIKALINDINSKLMCIHDIDTVVAPPCIYLPLLNEINQNNNLKLAAQNTSQYDKGAYTGEISLNMLKEFNCEYVIVGHSERRTLFAETNQIIAEKFKAIQTAQLIPILCVGETLEQREANMTTEIVLEQINSVITCVGIEAFKNSIIAYEPVWAIGTGKTATPEQAQSVHSTVREHLAKEHATIASNIRILYGGSIKGGNAKDLLTQPDIDGGLVGGASLIAHEFITICQAASRNK